MYKSKINEKYFKHDNERICLGDILRDFKFSIIDDKDEVIEIFFPYVIIASQDCDLEQSEKKEILSQEHFSIIKDKIKDPLTKERLRNSLQENNDETFIVHKQLLPNILILPLNIFDEFTAGIHLLNVYSILQENIHSKQKNALRNNEILRYHFIESDSSFQVPELVIDFKIYFTLPKQVILASYKDNYLTTMEELFREKMLQRFSFYLSRIGVPDLT